jgi:hypothetical protein
VVGTGVLDRLRRVVAHLVAIVYRSAGSVALAGGKTHSTPWTPCSDGEGEFSEDRWEPMLWIDIQAEFIVAAAEVLDECVPGTDYVR